MRRSLFYMFLAFLLASPTWPQAKEQNLVSLSFNNADLVYVLKVLAKEMGGKAQIGPTVQGSVTVKLVKVPVEEAVCRILALQDKKYGHRILSLPELTLVVTAGEVCEIKPREVKRPPNSIRMEYILEETPAAKVVDILEDDYFHVEFTLHPSKNGFYARGSRNDLLQVKRELANLDRLPEPPVPPIREYLPVKYGDINEIRELLETLVPDVQYRVDSRQNRLIVEGPPGSIDRVREMLSE